MLVDDAGESPELWAVGEIPAYAGDKVETNFLPGTETSIELHGLLSFASVSMRGNDVYRVRPEHGAGHCRHSPG